MDEKDELFDELMKALEEMNEALEPALKQLESIRDSLKATNDKLGFTGRVEFIKENIRILGWDKVLKTYHPDNNIDDPASQQMFDLVKYVYEEMKRKGEV